MDESIRTFPGELTAIAGLLAAAGGLTLAIAAGGARGCHACLTREAVTPAATEIPAAGGGWHYQLQLHAGAEGAGEVEFSGRLVVAEGRTPGPARP